MRCLGLAAVALILAAGAPAAAPVKIAVFKFELLDTSGGEPGGEARRIEMITNILREKLDESKAYEVVEIGPKSAYENVPHARLAEDGLFRECQGCEAPIAKALGADQSLSGVVQKVSNLIIEFNVYIRNAGTGKLLAVYSVDIRGNTDDSWRRGILYLVRNRLLRDK